MDGMIGSVQSGVPANASVPADVNVGGIAKQGGQNISTLPRCHRGTLGMSILSRRRASLQLRQRPACWRVPSPFLGTGTLSCAGDCWHGRDLPGRTALGLRARVRDYHCERLEQAMAEPSDWGWRSAASFRTTNTI